MLVNLFCSCIILMRLLGRVTFRIQLWSSSFKKNNSQMSLFLSFSSRTHQGSWYLIWSFLAKYWVVLQQFLCILTSQEFRKLRTWEDLWSNCDSPAQPDLRFRNPWALSLHVVGVLLMATVLEISQRIFNAVVSPFLQHPDTVDLYWFSRPQREKTSECPNLFLFLHLP